MPLYEYECTKCHRRVEKIQSFSADPLTVCETCGGPLERLISAAAIQFKGSGWYVTDYAKKNSSPAASESKPADSKSSETKSDSGSPPSAPAKPSATESSSAPASTTKSY